MWRPDGYVNPLAHLLVQEKGETDLYLRRSDCEEAVDEALKLLRNMGVHGEYIDEAIVQGTDRGEGWTDLVAKDPQAGFGGCCGTLVWIPDEAQDGHD